MNKKILIAASVLIAVAIAMTVYFVLRPKPPKSEAPPIKTVSDVQKLIEINPISNPLEKKPELNPVEKTNPFKDAYKNPFE